ANRTLCASIMRFDGPLLMPHWSLAPSFQVQSAVSVEHTHLRQQTALAKLQRDTPLDTSLERLLKLCLHGFGKLVVGLSGPAKIHERRQHGVSVRKALDRPAVENHQYPTHAGGIFRVRILRAQECA